MSCYVCNCTQGHYHCWPDQNALLQALCMWRCFIVSIVCMSVWGWMCVCVECLRVCGWVNVCVYVCLCWTYRMCMCTWVCVSEWVSVWVCVYIECMSKWVCVCSGHHACLKCPSLVILSSCSNTESTLSISEAFLQPTLCCRALWSVTSRRNNQRKRTLLISYI